MGTFRFNPGGVFIASGPGADSWQVLAKSDGSFVSAANSALLAVLAGTDVADINASQPVALTSTPYKLQLLYDQAHIILDGGSPVDINELPVGFNITSMTANLKTVGVANGGDLTQYLKLFFDTTNISSFLNPTAWNSLFPIDPATFGLLSYTVDFSLTPKSLNSILADGFGISGVDPITNGAPYILFNEAYVTGVYNLVTGLSTSPDNHDPVSIGDTVQINSDGTHDLTEITQLDLMYTDTNGDLQTVNIPTSDFIIWITLQITFIWPTLPDRDPDFDVLMVVQGTEFSGSVTLGALAILIANGSGIYKLTDGKSNDTVYQDSASGPTTVDVAIPNPFVETGFIGG